MQWETTNFHEGNKMQVGAAEPIKKFEAKVGGGPTNMFSDLGPHVMGYD